MCTKFDKDRTIFCYFRVFMSEIQKWPNFYLKMGQRRGHRSWASKCISAYHRDVERNPQRNAEDTARIQNLTLCERFVPEIRSWSRSKVMTPKRHIYIPRDLECQIWKESLEGFHRYVLKWIVAVRCYFVPEIRSWSRAKVMTPKGTSTHPRDVLCQIWKESLEGFQRYIPE